MFLLFCVTRSDSADLAVPIPSRSEIANIGLQMVRSKATWNAANTTPKASEADIPITAADVLVGTRNLSSLAPALQNYIQHTFHKYAVSSQSFSYEDEKVLRMAAKASIGSIVQEKQVCFKLRPFIEIFPAALLRPNNSGSTGYGQSINLDNPQFAVFLTSLTQVQKQRITHGGGLKVNEFDDKQKAFINHLWQSSSQPDGTKFCSLPDTDVQVCFYLEADITQIYSTGSVTYLLKLPLPESNQTFYGFDSPKQGQVWMVY